MAVQTVIYQVILHIFSGMPNPKWTINSAHPKYADFKAKMSSASHEPLPSQLGYTGFIIKKQYENKASEGASEGSNIEIGKQASAALQWTIFDTMPEGDDKEYFKTQIEQVIGPKL